MMQQAQLESMNKGNDDNTTIIIPQQIPPSPQPMYPQPAYGGYAAPGYYPQQQPQQQGPIIVKT